MAMRLLGLDVGDKRIGVATAETEVSMSFPLTMVYRTNDADAIEQIMQIICEHMPDLIVAGMPYQPSGDVGEQAEKTLAFLALLKSKTDLPIVTMDERYTSNEANALLSEMGKDWKKRKKRVDAVAATIILRDYMNQNKSV